jgi:phage shock protein C
MNKLHLSKNKKIAGVCAGVAEYFGIDPTLVRIAWLVAVLGFGTGFLAYAACWLLMPAAEE